VNFEQFENAIRTRLPDGTVLVNPGGGNSTILRYTDHKVIYLRGRSPIYVSIRDLYDAYVSFRGKCVKTTDLKTWAPGVFDSSKGGHNCNATFFLLALRSVGAIDSIDGNGRRGNPFRGTINASTKK
jgi:hypothetical protein